MAPTDAAPAAMEASQLLEVLEKQLATASGGRDLEGRPLLLVPAPDHAPPPALEEALHLTLTYITSIYSAETRRLGVTALVDATRRAGAGAGGVARAWARRVAAALGAEARVLLLRPDAFWDGSAAAVDACARTQPHAQVIALPLSKLHKHVESSQLPEQLGGSWPYDHHLWLQNRVRAETLSAEAGQLCSSLDTLSRRLEAAAAAVASGAGGGGGGGLAQFKDVFDVLLDDAERTLQAGADLAQRWEQAGVEAADTADARARLLRQLEELRARRGRLEEAWLSLEASELERGVARVTAWILGPAEARLNAHEASGVGAAAAAARADRLRRDHEALELLCRETYGLYAELVHRIDCLPRCPDDLRAQRGFMDFACRSFASRLERRRNVLITAHRFSRLAAEYLERSDELLVSLERSDSELERRLEHAEEALRQLHEDSEALGEVERECVREGERLSDLLVMPVKDALGRHLAVERAADVSGAQRLLQQVCERALALRECVARHSLLLRQAALVRCYEADAAQAAAWLRQLGAAMRDQVGCSVAEIQRQKERHQDFQHTAKGSYEYGRQLVQAALALRQCCSLATEPNEQLCGALDATWRRLDAAAQEHMTRLRVSAVFHRSVDQHCEQLRELIAEASGAAPAAQEEAAGACRRARAQRLLAAREKLLLEVGRMVRLGRLLRTRLREPLAASDREDEEEEEQRQQQQEGPGGNATAVDAISERLAEVAELAERLDAALCAGDVSVRRIIDSENWGSGDAGGSGSGGAGGDRSDDDFLTASECTCTRSSSFHTASECASASGGGAASPSSWWEEDQPEEQPQQLVTTSVEERQGVIIHEVTETRTLKLSHSPSFGITSYHMTHEITDSGEPKAEKGASSITKETLDSVPPLNMQQKKQDFEEKTEEEIKLEEGLKEVSSPDKGYHPTIARHALKSIL